MEQSLRAARETELDETIVVERRKSNLSQEQQRFMALEEERKINVCVLGERKKTRKSRGRRMIIY